MWRILIIALIPTLVTVAAESPRVYVGDRYEHQIQAIAADASGKYVRDRSPCFQLPTSGKLAVPDAEV
jgi:hypothetical protein